MNYLLQFDKFFFGIMQKTPDFQLEAMTMMYHFCLIEDSGAAKVSTLPASSGSSIGSAVNSSNQNQSEILNNLLHVFLSSSDAKVLNIHILRNHFQGKIGVKDEFKSVKKCQKICFVVTFFRGRGDQRFIGGFFTKFF